MPPPILNHQRQFAVGLSYRIQHWRISEEPIGTGWLKSAESCRALLCGTTGLHILELLAQIGPQRLQAIQSRAQERFHLVETSELLLDQLQLVTSQFV